LRIKGAQVKTKTKFPWLFILLAYGWAWLWLIPVAVSGLDYKRSPLLFLAVFIGVFGPGLAGIFLTGREGDRESRRDFWWRAVDFRRIHPGWIVLMLLLWLALHLVSNELSRFLGNPAPASELAGQVLAQPLLIPIVVVLYFIQAGIEDLGWRGYLLEKLLKSWSPLKAALLVGIVHAFWHLPFFWMAGTNQIQMGFGLDFWLFIFQAVSFSLYATLCYIDNRHSTLAVILLHTIGNLCNDLFTLPGGTTKFHLYTLFMVAGAILAGLVLIRRKKEPAHNGGEL
jgi:membrane protease YdiL (CAAX protease family)